jgi:glutathione S-transferase
MKLYFSPGACSLHPHIALRETGAAFDLVRVDLRAHKTQDGRDYYGINPKGYVPALELDDGSILTEGAVIDQYIADRKPESKLVPPAGTPERYRVQEWLHFIATEIHKAFGPLFGGGSDEAKEQARVRIGKRFDLVAKELESHAYLVGDGFTVADAYLFNMLTWTQFAGIDLAKWPALQAFFARVQQRPSVQAALAAERS